MSKPLTFSLTVVTSVVAAIGYGIIYDQITIRICPEYFTVWHPRVSDSTNLTVIALIWGFIATWWMGLSLGLLLASFAVFGRQPLPSGRFILRTIGRILLWTAGVTLLTGLCAWIFRFEAYPYVMGYSLYQLGPEFRRRFGVDYWMHTTSYFGGLITCIVYCAFILIERDKLAGRQQP